MSNTPPPDLEPRFLPPEGWRWHKFTTPRAQKLRFGSVFPKDSVPHAVVICLPGLSEFGEKYFELAHNMLDRNLAFWVLDWAGQGQSDRHLKNPHKRHSFGFQNDIDDLHYFLMEYVKHACVHPDVGRIPMVMLGHSMGGNIGLRYLQQHPDMFECAAFSAPMLGIHAMGLIPHFIKSPLLSVLAECFGKNYVLGGGDFSAKNRPSDGTGIFSSDPERDKIHNVWSLHDPALQVGSVTWRWLYEAYRSCRKARKKINLSASQTPCILATAGKEKLVSNDRIRAAAKILPNAEHLNLAGARHEILMERDEFRTPFLRAFESLIEKNILSRPESLKPF